MKTPPNGLKVVARPEGDSGRAFHHRSNRSPSPGGAPPPSRNPSTGSVADRRLLVTSIAEALRTLRGQRITTTVAVVLAELVKIEVPWMSMDELGELVAPAIAAGCVLDEQAIEERARNIATVAIHGGGR